MLASAEFSAEPAFGQDRNGSILMLTASLQRAHMTDIPLIEGLLTEVQLGLDQMLLDGDALTLEALADLVARIDGEIEALAAEDRARLEQSDVGMRLEALRQEIDRRMALH